mgnify:CR=1 FL=1
MKQIVKSGFPPLLRCLLCASLLFFLAGQGTVLAQNLSGNASALQAVEPEKRSFSQPMDPSQRIKEPLPPEQRTQPGTTAPFPPDPRRDPTPGREKAVPDQALPPERRMYSENGTIEPQQALEPEDLVRSGNETDPRGKLTEPRPPEQRRLPATPDRAAPYE